MSRLEDDKAIIAMRSAGLSVRSIADTMEWADERIERRLQVLMVEILRSAGFLPVSCPNRVRQVAKVIPPIPPGEGLVTRTFALSGGGRGAAVLLDDRRLVFTETGAGMVQRDGGPHPIEHGDQIRVAPGAGCFRLLQETVR